MGLLTIIKKLKEKEKEIRILILGLDNAGKTTIVKRISGEQIDGISPTLGFSIQTLQYKDFKLNIWDIGGQKTIRSYWKNYFEESSALIWVVDSADKARFALCKEQLHELLLEEKLAGAPLLILANKQDLSGASPLNIIHIKLELDKLSKDRNWCIMESSAMNGQGLIRGIDWLISALPFSVSFTSSSPSSSSSSSLSTSFDDSDQPQTHDHHIDDDGDGEFGTIDEI